MMSFCDTYMSNLSGASMDSKRNELEKAIKYSVEKNIPSKLISSRLNHPWSNKLHRRLCRKKQKLHNTAKRSRIDTDWANYRAVKKKLRQYLTRARNEYVSGFQSDNIRHGGAGGLAPAPISSKK